MDFSSFIGFAEWNEFEQGYRTSQFTCRATPPSPQRFRTSWSDWELVALQRFTRLPQDEGFRLFTRGRQVPREAYLDAAGGLKEDALQKLWASGVSVTMANLENYSDAVLALTRSLEVALSVPVQVNFYLTPGTGQGLGTHADDHDVLVLQIQGSKTWEIYPPGTPGSNADAPPATQPIEIKLEQGGWLYLPKGVWHRVRNQATEPSLHFTFSFHPMTWGRLLQRALERAMLQEPALRQTCPPDVAISPEQIASIGSTLHRFIEHPDVYYRQFPNLRTAVPPGRLVNRDQLERTTTATRFIWRGGEVEIGADGTELNLPYRRRPLRLRPELAPLIRQMATQGSLCPAECASPAPADALLLCRFLANVGVLHPEE